MTINKTKNGYELIVGNVPVDKLIWDSPDEIQRYTQELLDGLAPNSGFVLSSGNAIIAGVKPENYLAIRETVFGYKVSS